MHKFLTATAMVLFIAFGALAPARATADAAGVWHAERVTIGLDSNGNVIAADSSPIAGTRSAAGVVRPDIPGYSHSSGFAKYCPSNFGVSNCLDVQQEVTVYFEYNYYYAFTDNIYCQAFYSNGANGSQSWIGTVNNGADPPTNYASAGCNWQWHFLGGSTHTSFVRIDFDKNGNWSGQTYDDCPSWSGCL